MQPYKGFLIFFQFLVLCFYSWIFCCLFIYSQSDHVWYIITYFIIYWLIYYTRYWYNNKPYHAELKSHTIKWSFQETHNNQRAVLSLHLDGICTVTTYWHHAVTQHCDIYIIMQCQDTTLHLFCDHQQLHSVTYSFFCLPLPCFLEKGCFFSHSFPISLSFLRPNLAWCLASRGRSWMPLIATEDWSASCSSGPWLLGKLMGAWTYMFRAVAYTGSHVSARIPQEIG